MIWNDEDEGDAAGTDSLFCGAEIVISPLAKGNACNSTVSLNHSSDLLTMQELFGLAGPRLGGSAGATDLADLFQAGAITASVPEPASWAMMLAGFGALGTVMRSRKRADRSIARTDQAAFPAVGEGTNVWSCASPVRSARAP